MAKGKVIPMNQNSAQQAPKINIDPFKLKTVTCPNCESIFFTEVSMFKEVPAVMSPNGQASMLPIPVVICNECGNVHPKFTPKEFFESND
jgi:RNase P subunit RPR2